MAYECLGASEVAQTGKGSILRAMDGIGCAATGMGCARRGGRLLVGDERAASLRLGYGVKRAPNRLGRLLISQAGKILDRDE